MHLDYEIDGQWWRITMGPGRTKVVVGREPGCDLRADIRSLSRKHCAFVWVDGKLVVVDNGSSAGTKVNLEPVEQRIVGPGDIVTAGALIIYVRAAT